MARVTSKSQVRSFTTAARAGSVFSIDLLDKDGGEIRASFFNKAADKFYASLEQGKVYTFSKGNVKVANKKYSSSKHTYELTFEDDAMIVEQSAEASEGIESIKYNFARVRDLQSKSVPCTVDLIGVVREAKPLGKVPSKSGGEELQRRTVSIVDQSECSVEVTLWQESALKFEESALLGNVLALKGVSVREYNSGRSCSTLPATQLEISPNISETTDLQGWWSKGADKSSFFNISSGVSAGRSSLGGVTGGSIKDCNISDMKEDCSRGFISAGSGLSFEVIGYLSHISTRAKDVETPIYYNACPNCNRKLLTETGNKCQACDKNVEPNPRYLLRAQFTDHSDECYLSCFHDQALSILGKNVSEFIKVKENGASVSDELRSNYFRQPWLLKVRAIANEYKGEVKAKVTVVSCEPVDFAALTKKIAKRLAAKYGFPLMGLAKTDQDNENIDANIRKRKFEHVEQDADQQSIPSFE